MGLRSVAARIRRSLESPNKPLTDASLVEWAGGNAVEAGVSVTPETALTLTAIYRAISIRAGLVGSLPLKAYRDESGKRIHVESEPIDEPHPDMTSMEVWEFAETCLCSWGNAYFRKVRDGLSVVRELHPIHPAAVKTERKAEWRNEANPSGKRFTVHTKNGERVYTPYDILHIPGLSYDGVTGLSPIGLARQGIGLAIAAERFGARMFSRGALVPMIAKTDQELNATDARRIRRELRAKMSGADNQWDIPLLDSGLSIEKIGLPPQDVQYIDMRRFQVSEAARMYGIPPHLLADVEKSTSWGSGIEQQNLGMLIFTLDPDLVRIEQRMTKEILPGRDYAKFTRQGLLRADMAARSLYYERMQRIGALNQDDIRELEDKSPIPDGKGQIHYVPANLKPVNAQEAPSDDSE